MKGATMKINNWTITPGYEAHFDQDDFEAWWRQGASPTDKVTKRDERDLLSALVDMAMAEERKMTQSITELREEIRMWANQRSNK
jgi:hypothetical protein